MEDAQKPEPRDPGRSPSHALWSVDLLRGLLAVAVAAGHCYGLVRSSAASAGWNPVFLPQMRNGVVWVAGFFLISGYCIALSTARSKSPAIRYYALARLTRVLPMYGIGLAVAVAVEAVLMVIGHRPGFWPVHFPNLFWQIFLLQGLFGRFGAYDPSWSITQELIAYFAWGLLLTCRVRTRPFVGLVLSLLGCLAVGLAYYKLRFVGIYAAFSVPFFLAFWFIGALSFEHAPLYHRVRLRIRLAVIFGLALVVAGMIFGQRIPESLVAVPAGLLIQCAILESAYRKATPRFAAMCAVAGDLSYPLYLVHGPTIILVAALLYRFGMPWHPAALWGVYLAVSLLVAGCAGVPIERGLARARGRYLSGLRRGDVRARPASRDLLYVADR